MRRYRPDDRVVAHNKQLNPTSTALIVLCFTATLAQNNQPSSGPLAERYAVRGNKQNKGEDDGKS